jgi:hypothetical protein
MASQHYALVSRSSPLLVNEDNKKLPQTSVADFEKGATIIRDELTSLYHGYADLYPNPRLVEEARERDKLLQAASAAVHAQQSAGTERPKKQKRGFFSLLFGGGSKETGNDDDDKEHANNNNTNDQSSSLSSQVDKEPLIYIEPDMEQEDNHLCGTTASLDVACIPEEAYSVARFHLTSTRTRREQPNAVRGLGSEASGTAAGETLLIVVGLGRIAEFHNSSSSIQYTSDRDDLYDFCNSKATTFHVEHVRAASLGPNCLAISWGFGDGIVVVYRRLEGFRRLEFPDIQEGWEAVAMLSPTRAVIENMTGAGGECLDEKDFNASPLLRVSDMIPLLVASPSSMEDYTEHSSGVVATLAIARLGGYMELVPLPTLAWQGDVWTPQNHQLPTRTFKRKRTGKHYAIGKLRNDLASEQTVVALTTGEYHVDIMCLAAFRTQVTGDTEWNHMGFPDGPPSEFVLCASGTSQTGQAAMTFWAISFLFPDGGGQPQLVAAGGGTGTTAPDAGPGGFQLHAALMEARTVSSGADVSIFATPGILQRWRSPRQVQLRADAGLLPPTGEDANNNAPSEKANDNVRVTTISTACPIVSMRFVQSDGSNAFHAGPFLTVLDWNGGVTILDCSFMENVASQSLSQREYDLYRNVDPSTSPSLATTIVTRSHFIDCIQKSTGSAALSSVSNHHWLRPSGPGTRPSGLGTPGTLPPLILLSRNPRKLQIITFGLPEAERDDGARGPNFSLTSLPFPGHGATMESIEEGNISFVSLRRDKTNMGAVLFKSFVMQRLQPQAIIQSLARASKFQEAIQAASILSEVDQNAVAKVVQDCHRRLWESKHDVTSLRETQDATYIVHEVTSWYQSETLEDNVTLEKLRSVGLLALQVAEKSRLTDERMDTVREFLVKLGTYELLCRYLNVETSVNRFRKDMAELPVKDLAVQFAQTADILALSIVFFRHRREMLRDALDILDKIPLSSNPASYGHLLPVIRGGAVSDCFLSSTLLAREDQPVHWSHMPQHLHETDGHIVVLDAKDEKLVLDHNKNYQVRRAVEDVDLVSDTADWFTARAGKMQVFVGNVQPVILLCELGLRCASASTEQPNLLGAPAAIQQLYKTWKSASSLQIMLADGIVALDREDTAASHSVTINTEELLSMDLVDLVALVLHGGRDKADIFARCTRYLQPLLTDITLASATDNDGELDSAVTSYCIGLVRGCSEIDVYDKETEAELVGYARQALSACAAIAAASRTSAAMQNRLIKDKEALIQMVVTAIHETSLACERLSISPMECRYLIDAIWDMYEALPVHIPSSAPSAESWFPLLEKLDMLFKDLVGVDILSRWPGCHAFAFYIGRQKARNELNSLDSKSLHEDDISAVVELCRSYTAQVGVGQHQISLEAKFALLHDLLNDIEQLNDVCYDGSIQISTIFCTQLVGPLLQHEQFQLVAEFLSHAKPELLEKEQIKDVILSYVNEAVFSDSNDVVKIQAAIRCQDILGPVFPDVRAGFLSVRRYLDAANFISTVLYEGRGTQPVNPADLRRKLPLDVVESVLAEIPASVVCGCSEWMDESFARRSNETLRRHIIDTRNPMGDSSQSTNLPKLPGGAIFHLATILGLEDDVSALVVKCRVSHYAITEGMYGAAAAICRTLVCGEHSSLGNDSMARAKLSAVAEVISEERYADIDTMRELCTGALQRYTGEVSVVNSHAFDAIIKASAILDQRTSCFSRNRQHLAPNRPIVRHYRQIQGEYNADVHALFSDLLGQTAQGLVHDSLMNALSRFIIYWCVSDSVRLKSFLNCAEKADARDVLALGSSLILHIPSKETALKCLEELQKIVADQVASVSTEERFSAESDLCVPNPNIVRQLVHRGYSENGARRATVMTQNTDVNAALGWAVAHSLDSGFNSPIVIVQTPHKKFIDEDAILELQKILFAISDFVLQDGSIATFLQSIVTMHKTGPTSYPTLQSNRKTAIAPASNAQSKKTAALVSPTRSMLPNRVEKSATSKEAQRELAVNGSRPQKQSPQLPQNDNQRKPVVQSSAKPLVSKPRGLPPAEKSFPDHQMSSPPPPRPSQPSSEIKSMQSQPIKPKGGSGSTSSTTSARGNLGLGRTATVVERLPSSSTTTPQFPSTPAAHATVAASPATPQFPTTPTAASVTVSASLVSAPTVNRDELRKRGEAALSKIRNRGSPDEDRKRLIAEGRALLRKARAGAAAVPVVQQPTLFSPPPVAKSPPPPPKRPPAQSRDGPEAPLHNNGSGLQAASSLAGMPKVPPSDLESSDQKEESSEDGSGWDFDDF